ncbi:hypothetical protein ABZ252_30970 [Streptomyces sp. NPDC006175]|uniref:hypothetical protein n=1 Tax=unclassified Streptomyces TaxID=2593676 RepID=UPI0033ACE4EF
MIIAVPLRDSCVGAEGHTAGGLPAGASCPFVHVTVTVDEIVDNMPDEKVSGIITDAPARAARGGEDVPTT